MGTPKALVHDSDGTSWLRRSVRALSQGGCEAVYVVLGAAVGEARELLIDLEVEVEVIVADDWADGMSASLRAGLSATQDATAVLISLVDLPDVGPEVVSRVLAAEADLARATYDGRPGHPVLIGRAHLEALAATLDGDLGARVYLEAHEVLAVECGDLATGRDRDRP